MIESLFKESFGSSFWFRENNIPLYRNNELIYLTYIKEVTIMVVDWGYFILGTIGLGIKLFMDFCEIKGWVKVDEEVKQEF